MKARKRRLFPYIFWPLLVLGAMAGAYFAFFREKEEGALTVTFAKVDRGDLTSVVSATGKVQPQVEVRISSEVSGEIVELPVKDGQTVSKGQLLVRVNPSTLEAQVKQQQASLLAAKAAAAQTEAERLQAELDLERMRRLRDQDTISKEQLDQAETAQRVQTAAHEAALYRIQQQEMQLAEAEDLLSKATIYAPIDGTVTMVNSELGDRVVATGQFEGTEIMRVANLQNMEVRVEVPESDIVGVKLGDVAEVVVDALPDEQITGTVVEIANSAQVLEQQQESLITFLVKVRLENPDPRVRPGMTATADIKTATTANALRVPIQAVTVRTKREVQKALSPDEEGESATPAQPVDPEVERELEEFERVVFVVSEGKAIMRPVETGIADRHYMEILKGLEEGEQLVSGPYRVLTRELNHEAIVREDVAAEKAPVAGS